MGFWENKIPQILVDYNVILMMHPYSVSNFNIWLYRQTSTFDFIAELQHLTLSPKVHSG